MEREEISDWPVNKGIEFETRMRCETETIKVSFVNFCCAFEASLLKQQACNEITFNDLKLAAEAAFDDEDLQLMPDTDCGKLLAKIVSLQSYVNFDFLVAIVTQCGTEDDIDAAKKYTEECKEYIKNRTFKSREQDNVIFVLDKGENLQEEDLKLFVCKTLGLVPHKTIVYRTHENSTHAKAQLQPKISHHKFVSALMREKTKAIKIHYMKFFSDFKKSFLTREKNVEANFEELRHAAINAFGDKLLATETTTELLNRILTLQSYVNFDQLDTIVSVCGSDSDKLFAKRYKEAFSQYTKEKLNVRNVMKHERVDTIPLDYAALLKNKTKNLTIHYEVLTNNFLSSLLKREEEKEVDFEELRLAAINLFGDESMKSIMTLTNLLLRIFELQSYNDFDRLRLFIQMFGSKKDQIEAEIYTREFERYVKERSIASETESSESGVITFMLDDNQAFRNISLEEFKLNLCKLLGISLPSVHLLRITPG